MSSPDANKAIVQKGLSSDAVTILSRWVDHGGAWRGRPESDGSFAIELCSCAGEPQEQLQVDEPALVSRLRQLEQTEPGMLRTEVTSLG